MNLDHVNGIEEYRASVVNMDEAEIFAQMIGLGFAVDALSYLLREGCTEQRAQRMREVLREQSSLCLAECTRRQLPTMEARGQTDG